jgi:hypothetical protein
MLVPSEDNSIESARLARAQRTDNVLGAWSATAMVGFILSLSIWQLAKWSYQESTLAPNMAEDAPFALY